MMPTSSAELHSPYLCVFSYPELTLVTLKHLKYELTRIASTQASVVLRIVVTNTELSADTVLELNNLVDVLVVYKDLPPGECAERIEHALLLPLNSWQPVDCDITDVIETVRSGRSGRMFFATGKAEEEHQAVMAMRRAVENLEKQGCDISAPSGTVIVVRSAKTGIPLPDLKLTYSEFRSTIQAQWHIQGLAYDGIVGRVEVDVLVIK